MSKNLTQMWTMWEAQLLEKQKFLDSNETRPSRTSNRLAVNERPECTLWIEVLLANGKRKLIAVEALHPSKVVMTVCNSTDTMGLTRTH